MAEDAAVSAEQQPRRVVGRPFQKGVSGNPGGRQRSGYADWIRQIKSLEPAAIEALKSALEQRPVTMVGLSAAIALFDRTRGKPAVNVQVDGEIDVRISVLMAEGNKRLKELGREIELEAEEG